MKLSVTQLNINRIHKYYLPLLPGQLSPKFQADLISGINMALQFH